MKRIGIVTFHRAKNLGACLQAYALQNVIGERYDCKIVDYRNRAIEDYYYKKKNIRELLLHIYRFIRFPRYEMQIREREIGYKDFRSCLDMSEPYYPTTIESANGAFDLFVVGSDQVWNLNITGDDFNYFLEFAPSNKRVSYSASFGRSSIDDSKRKRVIDNITKFKNLFVREISGKSLISNLGIDLPVLVTVDPVFLLDSSQWEERINHYYSINYEYILLYFISEAQQTYSIEKAREFSRKLKCRIILINGGKPKYRDIVYYNDVSPFRFIELIHKAKLIITTSFHAMSFSLIFNRPFFYELAKSEMNTNSRLIDLSNLFGVEKCELCQDTHTVPSLDWNNINQIIETQSKLSLAELYMVLSDDRRN